MDCLWRWVRMIKRDLTKGDWDSVLVIDGDEGSGKSTLAAYLKAIFEETWNMDRIIFDPQILLDAMQTAPQYSTIVFDEAILGLFKRDWYEDLNKVLAKSFSICRERNLFFILNIPNINDLDKHLIRRCQWRFYVYAKYDKATGVRNRGFMTAYWMKKNQWTKGDPWQVPKFKYKFPQLPKSYEDKYREFKHINVMHYLGLFDKKVARGMAKEPPGYKKEKGKALVIATPDIDIELLARELDCSHQYARQIRNTWGIPLKINKIKGKTP